MDKMAVESDATLLDTSVNSGVAVELNALTIKWSWSNFLNSVQGPGKPSTLTRNQRLAKNVLLGFSNPDYILSLIMGPNLIVNDVLVAQTSKNNINYPQFEDR